MRKTASEVRSSRQNWRQLARFAVFPLFVSIATLWTASSAWRDEQRLTLALQPIQAQLEAYHREYFQYPESLAQIGIPDDADDGIHYQREAKDGYVLWVGTQAGRSKTFH